MKVRKLISLLVLIVVVCGSELTIEGCFEPGPGYGYGYGYSTPYYSYRPSYAAAPVVYGDWDEHHVWHDRDWWIDHRGPWVEEHHHEWLTARPAPHELYGHHDEHEHD